MLSSGYAAHWQNPALRILPMPSSRRNRIDIAIQDPFKESVPRSWLRGVAAGAVKNLDLGEPCQLSLVITDDDTLRGLNRDYRGLDEITDVLSFSTVHEGHWQGDGTAPWQAGPHPNPPPEGEGVMRRPPQGEGTSKGGDAEPPFIYPEDEPKPIGEVIISYPQVVRQAKDGDVRRELSLLVVHGILHLVGYDHAGSDEEAVMWAKQEEVLSGLRP